MAEQHMNLRFEPWKIRGICSRMVREGGHWATAPSALKHYLLQRGLTAERVPLSGSAGGRFAGDLLLTLADRDLVAEAKVRANGFRDLYASRRTRSTHHQG
jgi:hypothetical protein